MKVLKTIKLFIGGQFPRTESGRSYPAFFHNSEKEYARLCQGSRKDLRNSVEAAKKAQSSWGSRSAYNRGQILYRMAEMLEGKRDEFNRLFNDTLGLDEAASNEAIDSGINNLVHYAGMSDKYEQLLGSKNPVNAPYHNFTSAISMGLVMIVDQDEFDFPKLLSDIAATIVSGNTTVVLLGPKVAPALAMLGEVFATSDLPGGVVNLLSGHRKELIKHIGDHREIHAIRYTDLSHEDETSIRESGADNMKRMVMQKSELNSLSHISQTVEFKTVWHPIGV